MVTILLLLAGLTAYGIWEFQTHHRRLRRIPIRIHVNGTRGKSSVTRLIAAGLRTGPRRTVAKCTGTTPRFLLEDGSELPIHRAGSPNIIEQLMIVSVAEARGAEILVIECMAVQPHLQWISEERMIRSTLGVITNARADHLDQMGPTVFNVAEALANTIPKHSTVYTAERAFRSVFERRAAANGSTLVAADADAVSDEEIAGFSYVEHKENVALALAVCAHFGIERATALEAMQRATPDQGALQGYPIHFFAKNLLFYNAFAANDRDSTLMIAKRLGLKNRPEQPVFWIVNNRGDRLQRAEQFGEMIAADIEAEHVFLVGDFTKATHDIAVRRGFPPHRLSDLGHVGADALFEAVVARVERSATILGVGNIGGAGREIVTFFKNRSMEWSNRPSVSGSFSA
ncbi:MAG TPA: poly-gamma-glutamate synthase PgsB [Nitrospiria bacterium]|nr:poly-gamma-glutamate synthase PgsB [Nitrospiria bacterium]